VDVLGDGVERRGMASLVSRVLPTSTSTGFTKPVPGGGGPPLVVTRSPSGPFWIEGQDQKRERRVAGVSDGALLPSLLCLPERPFRPLPGGNPLEFSRPRSHYRGASVSSSFPSPQRLGGSPLLRQCHSRQQGTILEQT